MYVTAWSWLLSGMWIYAADNCLSNNLQLHVTVATVSQHHVTWQPTIDFLSAMSVTDTYSTGKPFSNIPDKL